MNENPDLEDTSVLPEPSGDAHKIALEYLKQVIALAAAVLALSATFIGKAGVPSTLGLLVLGIAWVSLTGAVFFGLEAISAIVKSRLRPEYEWSEGYGRRAAALSKYCFVAGLALVAFFAILAALYAPKYVSDCPAPCEAELGN